jgi:hypothetical protein
MVHSRAPSRCHSTSSPQFISAKLGENLKQYCRDKGYEAGEKKTPRLYTWAIKNRQSTIGKNKKRERLE